MWGVFRLMKIYRNTGISPVWRIFVWRSRTRWDISQRLLSKESALLRTECLPKCQFHRKYLTGSTLNWEKGKQIPHRQVTESHSMYMNPRNTSKPFLFFCYLSIFKLRIVFWGWYRWWWGRISPRGRRWPGWWNHWSWERIWYAQEHRCCRCSLPMKKG